MYTNGYHIYGKRRLKPTGFGFEVSQIKYHEVLYVEHVNVDTILPYHPTPLCSLEKQHKKKKKHSLTNTMKKMFKLF